MRVEDLQPDQVARIDALLDEAIDLPPPARAAWRAALAQREPALSGIVVEMLAGMAASSDRQRAETRELVARALARATQPTPSLRERRIGPYTVESLLGRGGMGSVWLARRSDGLFERLVALKLLHPGLAGAASAAERFKRERNILAALDHPNIARLLDAGVTDDGQPYLALEYVAGLPLFEYCDQERLDLGARIELMLQVLRAVQVAHQALVIHRDLKPANILVTPEGQARLLDFGIAKLMPDGNTAGETELTRIGGRAMTPDYASPEQVAGRPVGTASDVYSLGVVLYGLLCGERPYRLARGSHAALEEAILSAEPARPSRVRLSDAVALARSTTAGRLAHALAGDLDTIVMKALQKDPAQRYPTADALLQDLQRWRSGQPVLARPASAAYRLRKYVVRHRVQVAVGCAVAGALVLAAGVSLVQADRARTQAHEAQAQAQRAQATQRFLLDIFKANSVQQADPLRARQTTARELLDVGAAQVQQSLADAPEAKGQVLETLADMYVQLGLREDGARLRAQRIVVLEGLFGPASVQVAHALLSYANDIAEGPQRVEAVAALARARNILDAARDFTSAARGRLQIQSAELQQYLSVALMRQDADQAVQHFSAHPAGWNLFHALQASARARYMAGDFSAAITRHDEALAEAERRMPGPTAWIITPWVQLAEAQTALHELAAAEEHYRNALALSRKLNGELSGKTLQTQAKLGGFLHATGRRQEGLALLHDAQSTLARKDANATSNAVAMLDRALGIALLADGRLADAHRHLATEAADLRKHYPDSIPLSRTLLLEAAALTALGRYDSSAAALNEAWAIWRRTGGDAVQRSTEYRYRLEQSRLLLARGDAAAALDWLGGIAPADDDSALPLRIDALRAEVQRAEAYRQQARPADALRAAQQALQSVERLPLRERFALLEADAALALGRALHAAGDPAGALAPLAQAVALRQAHGDTSSPWLAEALIARADALLELGDAESRITALRLLAQARSIHATHAELGAHFKLPLERVWARATQGRREAPKGASVK